MDALPAGRGPAGQQEPEQAQQLPPLGERRHQTGAENRQAQGRKNIPDGMGLL